MKYRAHTNYWIDVVIGITFVLSILSGLVLLLSPSGGYQGGHNPAYGRTVLLLGHHTWSNLHNWSSIAMAVGVFAHLFLHWKWLTRMTKRLFRRKEQGSSATISCPNPTV